MYVNILEVKLLSNGLTRTLNMLTVMKPCNVTGVTPVDNSTGSLITYYINVHTNNFQ
jgi:hypothetical protein